MPRAMSAARAMSIAWAVELPAQPTPSRACTPSLHPSACERQALDVRSADMRALFDGRCLELLAPTF